jgi:hypothetical protein
MIPGPKKLRSAAGYGERHLCSIAEDMGGRDYSRAMRSDMDLAMRLLNAAPKMVPILELIVAYVDAGCEDLHRTGAVARRILADIEGRK